MSPVWRGKTAVPVSHREITLCATGFTESPRELPAKAQLKV